MPRINTTPMTNQERRKLYPKPAPKPQPFKPNITKVGTPPKKPKTQPFKPITGNGPPKH
jgi:hypothetical protein